MPMHKLGYTHGTISIIKLAGRVYMHIYGTRNYVDLCAKEETNCTSRCGRAKMDVNTCIGRILLFLDDFFTFCQAFGMNLPFTWCQVFVAGGVCIILMHVYTMYVYYISLVY